MTQFATLALDLIVPSLTNPRKTFNAAKLTELAETIKASGVHQPILVRPLPGSRVEETSWHSEHGKTLQRRDVRPIYELVCGERRLRASKGGKVTKVMGDDCYQVKLNKGPSMPFYGSQITRTMGVAA